MSETDIFKHLKAFSGGTVVYEEHSLLGPRLQQNLQLVYVTEGGMTLEVDDRFYDLRPGGISLLLPGHRETFRMDGETRTCHGWTTAMEVSLTREETAWLETLPGVVAVTSRMRELIRLMEPLFQSAVEESDLELDALSYALLAQYIREGTAGKLRPHLLPLPLRRACTFLEEKFAGPLSVSDLAREAGVSPPHLIRLFRKHLHQTPMQSLWSRRLEEGERLLRHTGLGVAEIAYACGFLTPDHFSRRMKIRTGLSPRAFRRTAWQMPKT